MPDKKRDRRYFLNEKNIQTIYTILYRDLAGSHLTDSYTNNFVFFCYLLLEYDTFNFSHATHFFNIEILK